MADKTVDVLAVMDDAIGDVMVAQASGIATDSSVPQMGVARAAIAELIEASRAIAFHVANFDDPTAHTCEVPCREMDALFAALAGIGGAK